MDRFIDGKYVSLQSSTSVMYLHADDNWKSVSMRANPRPINAVWRVQRVLTPNGPFMFLQSAAYGRYLSRRATIWKEESIRDFAEQGDFDRPEDTTIMWAALSVDSTQILLLSFHSLLLARAAGSQPNITATNTQWLRWVVKPVPSTFSNSLWTTNWTVRLPADRTLPLLGQFQMEEGVRMIRYVVLRDGRCLDDNWMNFLFTGRSLYNLTNQLAPFLGEGVIYKIFIKAGARARPAPLVVDLPISREPLIIVINILGPPGMIGKNISGTGQQAQQRKPCTVTNNVCSDPGSSQSAVTPVSCHKSVDIKIEATTSTEGVIRAGGLGAEFNIGSYLMTEVDDTNRPPGMDGKNMSGTGQQAQQKKPCTVTNNVHGDPSSSQLAVTPVSGHKSVDIKIEAGTSTEGVIREPQQKKPCTVTSNVRSGPSSVQLELIGGHRSIDLNMEPAISTEDDILAGGLGTKDDTADFEGEVEQPSHPGLGYTTTKTEDDGSNPPPPPPPVE